MSLNIASYNVRGFRNREKRLKVSKLMSLENVDVLFLQETHCVNIKEGKLWEQDFKAKAFWSFGEKNSVGVGILVNELLHYSVSNINFDFAGRYLVLDLEINSVDFRFINVYLPNIVSQRKSFLNIISPFLVTKRKVILGGDFNFVENSDLDKSGGNSSLGCFGCKEMEILKKDFDLIDIFRKKFPYKKEYTWANSSVKCRLDRFYVNSNLLTQINSITHLNRNNTISDHSLVKVFFQMSEGVYSKGPGLWKCNVKVLHDLDFKSDLHLLVKRCFSNMHDISPSLWDDFKVSVKKLIQLHSKRLTLSYKLEYSNLQNEYFKLKELEYKHPGHYLTQLQNIEHKLNEHLNTCLDGSKIRAKVNILNDSEKPSRYFLKREKSRAENKYIYQLEEDGKTFSSKQEILRICKEFYTQLYTKESVDQSLVEYFLKGLPVLIKEEALKCEGLLSKDECLYSIKHMKNNKSPGVDGLPKEFYEINWNVLGDYFVKMANCCYNTGSLSDTQKTGIITLICKNKEKANFLSFWRPITLLCVDYKIISKCLTNRLKRVLPNIIHIDQTAAVPNRSIQDNVHLIRNIIDFSKQKSINCLILSLDQMKAFDRVSHEYMFQVLERFGFGSMFIKWVKLLYNDIMSTVCVNGYCTEVFRVERSVRQGCSLSPLLYVLSIEPFGHVIRNDNHIKGFKVPGGGDEARVSMYADDCTFILSNKSSVQKVLLISDLYGYASGAKLNKQKSWVFFIGNWIVENDELYNISCTNDIKICGIDFNKDMNSDVTFQKIFSKIVNGINFNRSRMLKLKGKAVLLNSMILSKLWYSSAVLPIGKDMIVNINKECFSFLWGKNKSEWLKRQVLYNKIEDGGLNLVNVEYKIKSFLVIHICSLLVKPYKKWQGFARFWLKFDLRQYFQDFNINSFPGSLIRPSFYEHALSAFKEFLNLKVSVDFNDLTTKKVYSLFMNKVILIPRVVGIYPSINYREAFLNLKLTSLSPESRDITFKMLHQIIPVRSFLYNINECRRICYYIKCVFCKNEAETLSHLFFQCSFAKPLWNYVVDILSRIAGYNVIINERVVIFNIFKKSKVKALNVLLNILLAEGRWAIWCCRNFHRFREKNVDSCFIKNLFISNIKIRLKADFMRLSYEDFESYGVIIMLYVQLYLML